MKHILSLTLGAALTMGLGSCASSSSEALTSSYSKPAYSKPATNKKLTTGPDVNAIMALQAQRNYGAAVARADEALARPGLMEREIIMLTEFKANNLLLDGKAVESRRLWEDYTSIPSLLVHQEAKAYRQIGTLYFEEGNYKASAAAYEKLVAVSTDPMAGPVKPVDYKRLISALERSGQSGAAEKYRALRK